MKTDPDLVELDRSIALDDIFRRALKALKPPPKEPGSVLAICWVCDVLVPSTTTTIRLQHATNLASIMNQSDGPPHAWITEAAILQACIWSGLDLGRDAGGALVIFAEARDPRHHDFVHGRNNPPPTRDRIPPYSRAPAREPARKNGRIR